jgi:16S rRNA (uracil1498-N3)-methyltransferase
MQVFYAPDINGNLYVLDEGESKHCIRVLRMQKGTPVKLIDGKGNLFEGYISTPDPKKCVIELTGSKSDFEKRNYRLHIAVSPIKNPDRFEWFVEKSVEIGVDEITPLLCRNTEKTSIKADRVNNIIISAMKQSLKAVRPSLNPPCRFTEFVQLRNDATKMIAHCNDSFNRGSITDFCSRGDDIIILIGPEGDFSTEEIQMAESGGFHSVHLGKSRLRTETAGIVACHSVYFINQ